MSPQVLPVLTQEDTQRRAKATRDRADKEKAQSSQGGDSGGADSRNLFSDPNQTSDSSQISPMIRRPPEQHDYAREAEETQKKYNSFEEELQHQIQRSHELNQKYEEKSKPLLESIINQQMHLDDAPPDIPPDPAIQKMIQAYQQKEPGGVNNIFRLMVLGVTLGLTAFGWRRGWGARAGILRGWANVFKSYAQGKKEAAKEQLDRTYEVQKLLWLENKERNEQLQKIYENRRLSLAEKSKVFEETEKLYGMELNQIKTGASLDNQQLNYLKNQGRVQRALSKLQIATHNKLSDFLFNSAPGKAWRETIMAETAKKDGPTAGRMVDPNRSDEDKAEAEELLPYEQFLKDYRLPASERKAVPAPEIQQPGQKGLPTKEQPGLKLAAKKFKEQFMGGGGQ